MTKRIDILTILMAVILSGIVVACSNDSYYNLPDGGTTPQSTMGITIALDGTSRSGENNGFEVGEGLENYLDIKNNNYRIYFFSTEDKFIDSFTPSLPSTVINAGETSGNNNYYLYKINGIIPNNLPLEFKIVTLFNWRNYPKEINALKAGETSSSEFRLIKDVTTIQDLCSHPDSEFDLITPSDNGWLNETNNCLIPFYGVREYNLRDYVKPDEIVHDEIGGDKLKGGLYIDLSKKGTDSPKETPIPLLRAMAKVEVIINDPNMNFKEVELINVNPKGFCAPNATDQDDYFSDYDFKYDYAKDFIHKVHLPWKFDEKYVNSDEVVESLEMTQKDGEKKWIAYIPEYLNNVDNKYSKIKVTLERGESVTEAEWAAVPEDKKSQYIYFTQNGGLNAESYDIWRNNIYRFTFSLKNFKLECQVDIQPFSEKKLVYDFGLMRDERGDLMVLPVPDKDGNYHYPPFFENFKEKYPSLWPPTIEGSEEEIVLVNDDDYNEDYYAIELGEYDLEPELWVKDKDGCRVLTNFGSRDGDSNSCSSRRVIEFFGVNQEEYEKDIYGMRRVHHFNNHWTIVIHPKDKAMYFRDGENETIYQVESWDDNAKEGWIISDQKYSEDNTEIISYFRKINSDGTLGKIMGPITIPNIDKDKSSE